MKMSLGIFLGILLILTGTAIIIRIVFNIDIPVFKILIALVFLYIGIRLLTGDFFSGHIHAGENAVIFGETAFKGLPRNQEYTVLFGQARIDLTQESDLRETQNLKINTIFGSSELLIREKQPMRIKADAAFAGAKLPGNNETAFGKVFYQSDSLNIQEPYLDIEANVVFGEFKVMQVD
ncbi:MAG: hypothetical protein KGY60_07075 [Bacteroidales bacterium]|nr:hypothetical protein [Bacteroidales bacterium]